MKKVPNRNAKVMPKAHLKLSNEDQAQVKHAHLSEANELLAQYIFLTGIRGALKSVILNIDHSDMTQTLQIATHMEQK